MRVTCARKIIPGLLGEKIGAASATAGLNPPPRPPERAAVDGGSWGAVKGLGAKKVSPAARHISIGNTVMTGLREIRDLEGTHRFCHFLLSKLMCNGHLLNVSIPKTEKSHAPFL